MRLAAFLTILLCIILSFFTDDKRKIVALSVLAWSALAYMVIYR